MNSSLNIKKILALRIPPLVSPFHGDRMDDGASLNLEDLISGKHPFVSHCLSDAEKNDRMRWAEKLHRDIQLAASSPIARGTFTIEGLKEELIRDLIFASGGLIGEKCSKEIFRTLVKSLDAKSI